MRVRRMERLQKYLAKAGLASRRKAEELIAQGLVKVNGKIVSQMGVKVDPERDRVTVGGMEIRLQEEMVYYLFNKPAKVMTTLSDPEKRTKIIDFLGGIRERVYPVGRLDYLTEGLLVLTNDGELAYRLTHPKYQVQKTYLARVAGTVTESSLRRLRQGVPLADGMTAPAKVRKMAAGEDYTLLEITIHEGRNRQVRRMCETIGYPVVSLKRTRFGPLELGDLSPGKYRVLSPQEVVKLKKVCQ